MKRGLIGVQLMMLKEKIEKEGVYETLKKVSDMGFHCIEVSQIPMTTENVDELKKASEDFDIKIVALSAQLEPMMPGMPGETLVTDFDKIVGDCKRLDCNFLRMGMLPMTCIQSKELVISFVKRADEMAKKLKEHNIEIYYHNHHIEFQKFDGEYLLDIIKRETEYMGFELDVHWIQRGGEDPVKLIKQYKDRITLLHLKDYRIGSVDMSSLDGGFDMQKFMTAFFNVVEFAEIGEGNLNIKDIIDTALLMGSQYFLIEQDTQYGKDPFDCLVTSRDNLIKLGYGNWFTA